MNHFRESQTIPWPEPPRTQTVKPNWSNSMFCCFCHSPCAGGSQKYCARCRCGVYCSKECQTLDWRSGHKQWCGVPYGIRGRDWEVATAVVSRAKGGQSFKVVALRRFNQDDRIMMERILRPEDIMADERLMAAMAPLEPTDGHVYTIMRIEESSQSMENDLAAFGDNYELKIKYVRNAVGSHDDRGDFGGICLDMSRLRHACDPNAGTYLDVETMRMVLHANRAIEPGEEITISYTDGLDPTCYAGD